MGEIDEDAQTSASLLYPPGHSTKAGGLVSLLGHSLGEEQRQHNLSHLTSRQSEMCNSLLPLDCNKSD